MDTLLVLPKDKEEFRFLSEMFVKMDIKSKVLSLEDVEDCGLLEMMQEVDRTEKVSRESIMNKLR